MLLFTLAHVTYGCRLSTRIGHESLVALMLVSELILLPTMGLFVDYVTGVCLISGITSMLPINAMAYALLLNGAR